MTDKARSAQTHSFAGIDLLRFLAALWILVTHFPHFFFASTFTLTDPPFHTLLKPIYIDRGVTPVQTFWAISGFIFFWRYADSIRDRMVRGREFFVLRFSRLYPLHLVTLLIVAVGQLAFMHWHQGYSFVYTNTTLTHFVFQLLFSSYWALQSQYSYNGPIWSVMLEELTYALFFLLAGAMRLSSLAVSIAVVAFFSLAWYQEVLFSSELCTCFLMFFIGGIVYLLRARLASGTQRNIASTAILLRLLCLCIVLATAANVYTDGWLAARILPGLDDKVFLHFAFTPALLMLFALPMNWSTAGIRGATLLGNLTYSSYMIHFPIQLIAVTVMDAVGFQRAMLANSLFFFVYLGVVLIASHFVFECFEKPTKAYLRQRMLAAGSLANVADVAPIFRRL